MKILFGCFLCVALVGCYDPHAQSSAVVRRVEAAGSGNLDLSSRPGLIVFFSNRPQLATEISNQCAPLYEHGDAHWAETAEGMVCLTAHSLRPPTQWQADQRGY